MINSLPVGKLPPDILTDLVVKRRINDSRVLLGPGVGLDCAVVDFGPSCLVFKSDPITFTTDELGWYAVQINTNDIVTTGALPRWLLMTLLLPEEGTTTALVEEIFDQVYRASEANGIDVIGGHTEITYGLDRPIIILTLIGEVNRADLVTTKGCNPGDDLLMTKCVPIEGISILSREFADLLADHLSHDELMDGKNYLHYPGISVLQDAQLATSAGEITAMHDPTEGGISGALWELAIASGRTLLVNYSAIPVSPLAEKMCSVLDIDPYSTIASGALLMTVDPKDTNNVCHTFAEYGIACTKIGIVEEGSPRVVNENGGKRDIVIRPTRDEIARLYGG